MKVKPSIVLADMDNYERILDEDGYIDWDENKEIK